MTTNQAAVRALFAGAIVLTTTLSAGAAQPRTSTYCTGSGPCLYVQNNGPAILGESSGSYGVQGATSNAGGNSAGIVGNDLTTLKNNIGVYGYSHNGTGVQGATAYGAGVSGSSFFGPGILGTVNASTAIAVEASNPAGTGLYATSTVGAAVSAGGKGVLYVGRNFGGNVVFKVSNGGDLTAEKISSGSAPAVNQPTTGGSRVVTYGAQSTQPALEDFGEADLHAGSARIRFDARFASAISQRARYLVFLTPQGPVSGTLYVTGKTGTGFEVREAGGRSSATFDYRIVAQPFGAAVHRLPPAAPM